MLGASRTISIVAGTLESSTRSGLACRRLRESSSSEDSYLSRNPISAARYFVRASVWPSELISRRRPPNPSSRHSRADIVISSTSTSGPARP